ncbi:MAG TPA: sialate O-acetylesterase [Candidatus Hydrogenedens sp.]|nr:sialate O-acetylesterase [Candidatus Hydrogenedens sp.]
MNNTTYKTKTLFLLVLCSIVPCLYSFTLTLDNGLTHYQVLQAGVDDKNLPVEVSGTCSGKGTIEVQVTGIGYVIIPWKAIGSTDGSGWKAVLNDIPVGGPYRVDFQVKNDAGEVTESTSILDILVGDLWIMAGQSNMYGVGNLVDTEEPHPLVHLYSMAYKWRIAKDPLHVLAESPDPVHYGRLKATEEERPKKIYEAYTATKGAGLGLPFALEMVRRTGRPIGLIASAHGGTSMTEWDPSLRDKGGESLYGSMYKQVQAVGGKVRGVLWYQGESDAGKDPQPLYKERMQKLVEAIRKDFADPQLPFYYVQIGRFVNENPDPTFWNKLQNDQLELEKELQPGGMVASIDLSLDDLIHAGTQGLKILGYRLANLVERDLFKGKVVSGPRPEKVERLNSPYGPQIKVTFSNVNGKLLSAGRPSGFTISSAPDAPNLPVIYKITFPDDEPDAVILWLTKMPEQAFLWYGRGFDPYCNIIDEANMAVPVFGPIQIP